MNKKYFWRRVFAYNIDLLICGFLATILVIALNGIFSVNILAPSLINSTSCEVRNDIFTPKRMNELLPLEHGQSHRQILCNQTNMLTTSFFITHLRKVWTDGNMNYSVNINFYSDENGKQLTYISSDPFLLLLAPFVFALFLARQGQTLGKRMLGLTVYNDAFEKPDFKSALKREYLKAIFFVLAAFGGLYSMFSIISFDIDEAAETMQALATQLEQSNLLIWATMGAVVISVSFWFHFGSFIRWRGQTYWDQFTNLNTNLTKEFNLNKSSRD